MTPPPQPTRPELVTLTGFQVDTVPVDELRSAYNALRDTYRAMLEQQAAQHADAQSKRADAIADLRAKSQKLGKDVAYGLRIARDGSTLVRHEPEQAAIAMARDLREQGYSLRKIATMMAGRGVKARSGNPFHPKQVSRLLAGHEGVTPDAGVTPAPQVTRRRDAKRSRSRR